MEYIKAFKTLLKSAQDPAALVQEVPYRKMVPILGAKSVSEDSEPLGERQAIFRMTDSGVDREGDIIYSSGMDVAQFSEFGSILWGHRADEARFVLGRPAEVMKSETEILVRVEFFDEDTNPEAERVLRMIKAGGLRAMSVGLMIREFTEAKDRGGWMPLNILSSEAIEASITPVPVNPRAVELAVGGKGDDEKKKTAELFEESVDVGSTLRASAESTGMGEEEIKSLVKETVDLLLAKHTVYSVPCAGSAAEALQYFARVAQ